MQRHFSVGHPFSFRTWGGCSGLGHPRVFPLNSMLPFLTTILPLAYGAVVPSAVSVAIVQFATDSCEASPCPFIAVMTETC